MIKFFRKIRQKLLSENKFSKYLLYAIGEIVLVVIGILIALQINNANNERVNRKSELKYLKNIQIDLKKDLVRLDDLIDFRQRRLKGDNELIAQINGAPIDDINGLISNIAHSLMEDRFSPNNTTFNELNNSGNLNLISNDSIKTLLLELEERYKYNDFMVDHESYDYREYISKPVVAFTNIDQLMPVYFGHKTTEELGITADNFKLLFKSNEYKNGLYIMTTMSDLIISEYDDIKKKSMRIIELIDQELKQ